MHCEKAGGMKKFLGAPSLLVAVRVGVWFFACSSPLPALLHCPPPFSVAFFAVSRGVFFFVLPFFPYLLPENTPFKRI